MSIVHQTLARLREEARQKTAAAETTESHEAPAAGAIAAPEAGAGETSADRIIPLNRQHLHETGLLPAEENRSMCAAQYRVIKQDLLRYCRSTPAEALPARLIMIGSALPGEGKSFTSMNLAMSMASEKDCDVLLIDGDVSKRHLSTSLDSGKEPGLLEVLRDSTRKFSSVVYPTDFPSLFFMPAGQWSEDASELIASDRMRELLLDVFTRHSRRVVIIDSSPILLTPDARAIANQVGQILLVVSAGNSLQANVNQAIELVQGSNRRTTLMLNRMIRNRVLDAFYGYGYGSGYGYSYDYAKADAELAPGASTAQP